ncbi:MAG: glycosyltransferase family 4 protein [Acidobacteriaceae bacterium]
MIRLYVPSPRPILPVRNTDWVYPRQLSNISQYCNQLAITFPRNTLFDVFTHARFGLDFTKRRAHLPIPASWAYKLSEFFYLPAYDPEQHRSDAIFAFERFPKNAKKPVIWMTGATDVAKLRRRGWSEKAIQQEIDFKREASERAAIVVFSTRWMQRQFEQLIKPPKPPAILQYFIFLKEAPWERITAKWEKVNPIRLLFVGRAAHRKGLPLVLAAYTELRRTLGERITLHVVTEECDGPIQFPSAPGITRELRTSRSRTTELMHAAHFFVMPSREENYPLVYIEAMASGAIPISSDAPNQREQLHEGKAGLLVERNVDAIVSGILSCIDDRAKAEQIVNYGRRLWEVEHQPSALGTALYKIASNVV